MLRSRRGAKTTARFRSDFGAGGRLGADRTQAGGDSDRGYRRLQRADGARGSRTFARLRVLREQTINPKIAEFGGRIIKTTGDGFLAEFPSATAALGCGVAIQRANFAQEGAKDAAERFHLRMGIKLGDIISDGDDVSGDSVNIAARLEPLAPLDRKSVV